MNKLFRLNDVEILDVFRFIRSIESILNRFDDTFEDTYDNDLYNDLEQIIRNLNMWYGEYLYHVTHR